MGRLEGKVAVITGAAGGMGRVAIDLFAVEGAKVVAADLKEPDADFKQLLTSRGITYVKADVTNEGEVENLINTAVKNYGRIDVLYNNHGVMIGKPFLEATMEEFDYVINANLRSVFMLCLYAAREMSKNSGGSIINVSSVGGGFLAYPNMAAYVTSKGGIVGLSRALAVDLAKFNIRVNAICPGAIDTPMPRKYGEQEKDIDAFLEELGNLHLIKRLGKPEEVVSLAVYLASDESSFMTGAAIPIDGGHHIAT